MGGTGLTKILARVGIQVPISTLIGKIVYWFVLLVFLVSAAQSLGLDRVSSARQPAEAEHSTACPVISLSVSTPKRICSISCASLQRPVLACQPW